MKVAFDHQIFTMQRYGGVSRYFCELTSRLPDHGVSEARVVAPLYINNYLAADSARRFTRGKYVPYKIGEWWIQLRRPISLLEVANQVAAPLVWRGVNADIIHETYYSLKPVGSSRRRVVTVYDMIHELFADEFPDAAAVSAAKRAAVNRADHVICISENTRRDLVRLYGIDPAQTSVVYLGSSLTIDTDSVTEEGGRPSLLFVGTRRGYKNFSTLLQAFASSETLLEFELIAFGGGPPVPDELNEISRLGITGRVRFEAGSDEQLAARYRAASAFVFPSKYEGYGNPPLEAMGFGCPVVCSNAGPMPEIVGDAAIYFDPNSAEELRTALDRVVTTDTLTADLRERGYRRIREFSWDKCAAETAQIYREIV
jgi:glycosyltransferase involved in cell wall biosynthesis